MGRKALLVVDMVNDFLAPTGTLYCGDEARKIINRVAALIDAHRRAGSLIIFIADRHAPDDKEFKLFPSHCVEGTFGADQIPELDPPGPNDPLVSKTRYSAFYGTSLDQILQKEGVDEAHLCGVCTSICIMETCSDLRNRDITAVVHQSAVADFDPEAHRFALKRMRDILGARIED